MDFNTAEPQQAFDLIPAGTIAKVRMMIKPGGHNDPFPRLDRRVCHP